MTGRRARAPGKVVLSGAYSVLEGAPAVVAAVNRYVEADGGRPAAMVTSEVQAAVDQKLVARACHFDASELRQPEPDGTTRKLGLGSSAAILAATYFAVHASPSAKDWAALVEAHRTAQSGGSGIDVVASTLGGVLCCLPQKGEPAGLSVSMFELPHTLRFEFFSSARAALTRSMRSRVDTLKQGSPLVYGAIIDRATEGAEGLVRAKDPSAFVSCLCAQFRALNELGVAANAPIMSGPERDIMLAAEGVGAAFGPSGAGGGDISFYCGTRPLDDKLRRLASEAGLIPLSISLGAPGAHCD